MFDSCLTACQITIRDSSNLDKKLEASLRRIHFDAILTSCFLQECNKILTSSLGLFQGHLPPERDGLPVPGQQSRGACPGRPLHAVSQDGHVPHQQSVTGLHP